MIVIQCKVCDKTVVKPSKYSHKQWAKRKTCSNKCSAIYRAPLLKGNTPWNKGTKGIMKPNVTSWKKNDPRVSGDKHRQWSGEHPKYHAVHSWVYKKAGKANHCENCSEKGRKMYHWANISGTYRRDLNDWKQLCVPCHRKFDKGTVKVYVR